MYGSYLGSLRYWLSTMAARLAHALQMNLCLSNAPGKFGNFGIGCLIGNLRCQTFDLRREFVVKRNIESVP